MRERGRCGITLEELRARRADILAVAERYGATNVRVFGSVARGDSTEDSDVDILATFPPQASIFDLVGMWRDLEALLDCDVDLIADHPGGGDVMRSALREARPL